MKMLKIIVSMLMLLSITACSDSREKMEDIKLKPYSVKLEKGEKMASENILSDEDSFYGLKIEGSDSAVIVHVNGMEVFEKLGSKFFSTFMPINQFLYSGKNKIEVKLFSGKVKINQLANFKVSLVLINKKHKVNQAISIISFDNNSSKDKLKGSSSKGQCNGIVNFYSPMAIGQTEFVEGIWSGGNKSGAKVTQTVVFSTPFPKWKFLDSELILDENFNMLSDEKYEKSKNLPKIEAFYTANNKIIEMIKNKKVKELMLLLKERNEEMDRAFGDPIGSTEKELFYHLNKSANDPTFEVYEPKNKKPLYLVEDNDKVAYIPKTIIFNKKDKSGSESYTFKFRYEKGKWIITR